jgi:2-dehydro-3-deoxygalactonokinase
LYYIIFMKTTLTNSSQSPVLLGIDWGTSNRRAWWLDAAGAVLAEHADDQGMLASQGRFAQALAELLAKGPVLSEGAPIWMAGMVGAATGWQEAPYMPASAPLQDLPRHAALVREMPQCRIVPGVCFSRPDGTVDVMRGEETQLLGALAMGQGDGWYVLPGTHSKWVRLQSGHVADLATFMTGELFSLLTQHGTLASITQAPADHHDESNPATPEAAAAFERGMAAAGQSALSNALFGCRAQVVSGRMPAALAREYLSGLLIGAEWHDIARRSSHLPKKVTLIGSAALERRYARVGALFSCEIQALPARDAQLAALKVLAASMTA